PQKIKGFHSPNGKWSIALLRMLKKFNYKYDVISSKRETSFKPFQYALPYINNTVRLYTIGDDWGLYQKDKNSEKAYNYFKSLYDKIQIGDLAGIGFHPWVLYSDNAILEGFEMFLTYLSEQHDVQIKTGFEYISGIEKLGD
ncbi:MAG: hypothetical protein R6U11_02130, partial [Bacteroidales bacterium]